MTSTLRYFVQLCAALALGAGLSSCDSPETVVVLEQEPEQAPRSGPGLPEEGDPGTGLDAMITVEGVRIGIPARWKPASAGSPFTAAQYTVPGLDHSLDATFTISNPIGGGLMYNTLRWHLQFQGDEATTESWIIEVDGVQVMEFAGRGTFDTRLPGSSGVQEDTAVLGAVPLVNAAEQVEDAEFDEEGRSPFEIDPAAGSTGTRNIFIKLTGPAETVDAAREEWDAMLQSLRIRDVSSWATP